MKRPALTFLAAFFFAASAIATARAQSNPPGQSDQSNQANQPTSNAQTAQPAHAQTTGQGTSTVISSVAHSQSSTKKVWTNDDVGDLRNQSAISTLGSTKPAPAKRAQRPVPPSKGKDATWYRDQIEKLQGKISPLNDQISQLQAALDGHLVDSVRHFYGVRPDDWRDQLSRLEKQRDDIQAEISALQDEARRSGIPSNQLP
jgi:hypothetical protein